MEGERLAQASDVRACKEVAPSEADLGPVVGTRVIATYGFDRGVLGEMHFLGGEERASENYGVDILGTEGQLALRCSRHVERPLWHLPRPMEGPPGALGEWRPVDVPEGANRGLVEAHYLALIDALRGVGPVPCPGTEARDALEMVLATYRSHRESGRRIEWPLTDRAHPLTQWGSA